MESPEDFKVLRRLSDEEKSAGATAYLLGNIKSIKMGWHYDSHRAEGDAAFLG